MSESISYIPSRLKNMARNGHVAGVEDIVDDASGKSQKQINNDVNGALSDRYTKEETYNKTQLNNMITTPNQEYVTVDAYADLPASGSADTIYRVSSYDGENEQVDVTKYSEYAWDGTQYVFLCVKSQIGEVFDISEYHSDATYADLAAALDTNGANVPAAVRRGGMSVKYVNSSDNKYVQYRLMKNEWSTTVGDWQGVDDEPTAGSENLVLSGGVAKHIFGYTDKDLKTPIYSNEEQSWNTYNSTIQLFVESSSNYDGYYFKVEFSEEAITSRLDVNITNNTGGTSYTDEHYSTGSTSKDWSGKIVEGFLAIKSGYKNRTGYFRVQLTAINQQDFTPFSINYTLVPYNNIHVDGINDKIVKNAAAISGIVGGASADYNTLGKTETKIEAETTQRQNDVSGLNSEMQRVYNNGIYPLVCRNYIKELYLFPDIVSQYNVFIIQHIGVVYNANGHCGGVLELGFGENVEDAIEHIDSRKTSTYTATYPERGIIPILARGDVFGENYPAGSIVGYFAVDPYYLDTLVNEDSQRTDYLNNTVILKKERLSCFNECPSIYAYLKEQTPLPSKDYRNTSGSTNRTISVNYLESSFFRLSFSNNVNIKLKIENLPIGGEGWILVDYYNSDSAPGVLADIFSDDFMFTKVNFLDFSQRQNASNKVLYHYYRLPQFNGVERFNMADDCNEEMIFNDICNVRGDGERTVFNWKHIKRAEDNIAVFVDGKIMLDDEYVIHNECNSVEFNSAPAQGAIISFQYKHTYDLYHFEHSCNGVSWNQSRENFFTGKDGNYDFNVLTSSALANNFFAIYPSDWIPEKGYVDFLPDPTDNSKTTIATVIKGHNNVYPTEQGEMGSNNNTRVQYSLTTNYNNKEIDLYTDLYFSDSINMLKTKDVSFFCIQEFWNLQQVGGASVMIDLTHQNGEDAIYFSYLHRWKVERSEEYPSGYREMTKLRNTEVPLPVGRWFTLHNKIVWGDTSSGRFYMSVIIDGEEIPVFDVRGSNVGFFYEQNTTMTIAGSSNMDIWKTYTDRGTARLWSDEMPLIIYHKNLKFDLKRICATTD